MTVYGTSLKSDSFTRVGTSRLHPGLIRDHSTTEQFKRFSQSAHLHAPRRADAGCGQSQAGGTDGGRKSEVLAVV